MTTSTEHQTLYRNQRVWIRKPGEQEWNPHTVRQDTRMEVTGRRGDTTYLTFKGFDVQFTAQHDPAEKNYRWGTGKSHIAPKQTKDERLGLKGTTRSRRRKTKKLKDPVAHEIAKQKYLKRQRHKMNKS